MAEYYEKQFTWWAVIGFAVFVFLWVTPTDGAPPNWYYPYFLPLFSLAMLFLFVNFFFLTIKIDDEKLTFGFGVIKKRINLRDIKSCKPHDVKFKTYLGYGIRQGFDNSWAYTYRSGKGIRIETDEGRLYVANSRNPEAVCRLIKPK